MLLLPYMRRSLSAFLIAGDVGRSYIHLPMKPKLLNSHLAVVVAVKTQVRILFRRMAEDLLDHLQ